MEYYAPPVNCNVHAYISILGLYYGVSICLVSFASAMAVVTLNIHHRGVRGMEVPDIIKQVPLCFHSLVTM